MIFRQKEVERLLEEIGIAFLLCSSYSSGLKKVMKVRRELKIPTIFNLIGPLTNPVQLETQLIGVYRRDMLETMAKVLNELGRKRAIVLNGADHMDEASLAGENHLVLLNEGKITSFTLNGKEAGLSHYSNSEIIGGDARENAHILQSILEGKKGAHLDTVIFNAAIALFAHGTASTIAEGVCIAKESTESGRALEKLQTLVKYSQKRRKQVI